MMGDNSLDRINRLPLLVHRYHNNTELSAYLAELVCVRREPGLCC